MIREIAQSLSSSLVAENSWLKEVRILGYQTTIAGEKKIVGNDEQIGLTDISDNSGYIRMRGDIRMEDGARKTSCARIDKVIVPFRIIIAAKTETPENLAWAIATQINATTFTLSGALVSFTSTLAGGNSNQNVLEETGTEQMNSGLRVIAVDFNAEFSWASDCPLPITFPEMCNCTSTLTLGCFNSCDLIDTGIPQTGAVTMIATFNGVSQSVEIEDSPSSENIIVDTSVLNESYAYIVQFKNSDGDVITLEVDGTTYDCFKFEIAPKA